MQCTKCQSDNVQSLSVIYESGTSQINTRSRTTGGGIGFGGGGLGGAVGGGRTTTSGTQQSHLAAKAAPPKKKPLSPAFIAVGIGLILVMAGLPAVFLIIAVAIGIFLGYRAWKYNKEEFPPKYEVWTRSWHCNKCGTIFSTE